MIQKRWIVGSLAAILVWGVMGCESDDSDDGSSAEADTISSADTDETEGTSDDVDTSEPEDIAETDTPETDTAEPVEPTDAEIVAEWLTGDFSSRAQSLSSPAYFDVHLYAIQIWPEREDGTWMYVQQSRDDDSDGEYEAPYRQRVYWVYADGNGNVVSTVYRITNEWVYVDPWTNPGVLDGIAEENLELALGCDVVLAPQGDAFVGGTQGTGCTLSFGGYATSDVTLTADKLQSLDLLYDTGGNIINGLTENSTPYTFDKLENFAIE